MAIIETGRSNADKFVATVKRMARDGRVVIVYADDRRSPWPWMRNPAWQNYVTDQLEANGEGLLRNPEFHSPDNVDGLCFTAISTAGYSRVEMLGLQETLDGQTPPSGRWAKMKWIFTTATMGFFA